MMYIQLHNVVWSCQDTPCHNVPGFCVQSVSVCVCVCVCVFVLVCTQDPIRKVYHMFKTLFKTNLNKLGIQYLIYQEYNYLHVL